MEAASSLCWVGLFLGRLRRWQLSCRLFPCRISPQILCSSHSTTSLRQSSCQRDPNPCPSVYACFSFCPCLCPCGACLWFCRPCQTIHSLGCFAGIQFFFSDNLSPCGHTMNSFLRTFDLGCPSRTNPSEQAVCFFVSIQRFQSLSQISSILSCLQC